MLLDENGYKLLTWLMTPHRESRWRSVLECLYNLKHQRGRSVVENSFGILKQCFYELLHVMELHVTFLPDVVVCCCLFHDLLLDVDDNTEDNDGGPPELLNPKVRGAHATRTALGMYLG